MPKEYNEIELSRFARRITFVQGRNAYVRSDDTDATTDLPIPFTGVLNRFPTQGYWQSSNLSYLALQPLVVRELTETVRESQHSIQPTSRSHRTDATQERTVFVAPPSILRPTTRAIKDRTVEERTPVERADQPQPHRQPPMTVTELPESVGIVNRIRSPPSTSLPELRADGRIQTAASEAVDPRVLRRTASTQQASQGRDGRTQSEGRVSARRPLLSRRGDVSTHYVSRPATPSRRVDERTVIDFDRWNGQKAPLEQPERSDVTSEVLEPSERTDVATEESGTEIRVGEKLTEATEQADLRVSLTTRSSSPSSSETSSLRRGRVRSPVSHTPMAVLETDGDDERAESGLDDSPGGPTENVPNLHPVLTDQTPADVPETSAPSRARFPDHTDDSSLRTASADETAMDFLRTPSPLGPPTDESRRPPKLTFKRERPVPDTNDRAAGENGHPHGTTSEHRQDNENNNQPEKHISSLPSTDNRHTDPKIDLDRLVDRLFTKFERKMRMERERRGL